MEVKVPINCEVKYHLIGFGDMSGYYTPQEFERIYDPSKCITQTYHMKSTKVQLLIRRVL